MMKPVYNCRVDYSCQWDSNTENKVHRKIIKGIRNSSSNMWEKTEIEIVSKWLQSNLNVDEVFHPFQSDRVLINRETV